MSAFLHRTFTRALDRSLACAVLVVCGVLLAALVGFPLVLLWIAYEAYNASHVPPVDEDGMEQGDRTYRRRAALMEQVRFINNTDFAEYLMDALQENPKITERQIVAMYLDDVPLSRDFLSGKEGEHLNER